MPGRTTVSTAFTKPLWPRHCVLGPSCCVRNPRVVPQPKNCAGLMNKNRRSALTEKTRSGDLTRRLFVVIHYCRSSAEHRSQDCRAPLDIPGTPFTGASPGSSPRSVLCFGSLRAGSSSHAYLFQEYEASGLQESRFASDLYGGSVHRAEVYFIFSAPSG